MRRRGGRPVPKIVKDRTSLTKATGTYLRRFSEQVGRRAASRRTCERQAFRRWLPVRRRHRDDVGDFGLAGLGGDDDRGREVARDVERGAAHVEEAVDAED